jgi:hypothetical protein
VLDGRLEEKRRGHGSNISGSRNFTHKPAAPEIVFLWVDQASGRNTRPPEEPDRSKEARSSWRFRPSCPIEDTRDADKLDEWLSGVITAEDLDDLGILPPR